jgi:hypothetical protein
MGEMLWNGSAASQTEKQRSRKATEGNLPSKDCSTDEWHNPVVLDAERDEKRVSLTNDGRYLKHLLFGSCL